jgi:hypothetical protein
MYKRNHKGKTVDSHNTKIERLVTDEAVRIDAEPHSVRVLQLNLVEAENLAIADDMNTGGDPYNSTGQHVIIKAKTNLED